MGQLPLILRARSASGLMIDYVLIVKLSLVVGVWALCYGGRGIMPRVIE